MKRSRFRLSLTVKAIYDEDLYRGLSLRKLQYIGNNMVELREAERADLAARDELAGGARRRRARRETEARVLREVGGPP